MRSFTQLTLFWLTFCAIMQFYQAKEKTLRRGRLVKNHLRRKNSLVGAEDSESQAEVLSYIIDIESMPKRQNPMRKTYEPMIRRRKYVVKNRSRNYGALARMSTNSEEESEVAVPRYSWTSVEETTQEDRKSGQQQPLVFEPFSTDPKKHAAVFAWIDQMINGYSDITVPTTKPKPRQEYSQVPRDQKKLKSVPKKPRTITVKIRPRRLGKTLTGRLVATQTQNLTTSSTIRIARTTSLPARQSLHQDSKIKGHYKYSLDNGPFGAREEFDGMETLGQYNINRSGFFHKTIYSVTPDSGFQADSTYSIFS